MRQAPLSASSQRPIPSISINREQAMAIIARIDDTELTAVDLIKFLKINNKFDQIIEDMLTEHVTTAEAPKLGVEVIDDEVQQ